MGVIGHNGAGKSTLLKLLGGIIVPDRGRLDNNGATVSLLTLQLGFVPYLSGRENALLSGMLLGATRAQVEDRMAKIAAFAELGDFFDEPIGEYSAGMRARLGFSVALEMEPDVILVDEVLGVGDADFARKSAERIRMRIRSDATAVITSHNLRLIEQLCDRVVWIEQGQTQEVGATAEVLRSFGAARRPLWHARQAAM